MFRLIFIQDDETHFALTNFFGPWKQSRASALVSGMSGRERTDWRGPHVTKTQLGEHDVVRPTVADKHVFGQVVSICIYLLVNVALTPVWRVAPCCLLTRAGWKICCPTLPSSWQQYKAGAEFHNRLIGHHIAQILFLVSVKWQGQTVFCRGHTTVTPGCCVLNSSSRSEKSLQIFADI